MLTITGVALAASALGAVIGLLVGSSGGDRGEAPSVVRSMAGSSMEPTLSHGDRMAAREIDGDEVARGDVVVVEVPGADVGGSRVAVKRVIGVAGDEIASVGDRLWLNGEAADEPYLASGTPTTNIVEQEVPPGHVFVMGDNRPNSHDSRIFGPVPIQAIVALVEPT